MHAQNLLLPLRLSKCGCINAKRGRLHVSKLNLSVPIAQHRRYIPCPSSSTERETNAVEGRQKLQKDARVASSAFSTRTVFVFSPTSDHQTPRALISGWSRRLPRFPRHFQLLRQSAGRLQKGSYFLWSSKRDDPPGGREHPARAQMASSRRSKERSLLFRRRGRKKRWSPQLIL